MKTYVGLSLEIVTVSQDVVTSSGITNDCFGSALPEGGFSE